MRSVDCLRSLGNPLRSSRRTRWPLRPRSMAVGAPAHRAPTTIASYRICPPAARLRLDPERVQLAGKDVIDSTKERIEIVVYSEKASRECVVPTARQLRAQLPGTFGSNEPFRREAKTIRLEQPRSNDAWMDGEDLNAPIT